MVQILMAGSRDDAFSGLKAVLEAGDIVCERCGTGQEALTLIGSKKIDLVILDENLPDLTGRQLVEKIVFTNPMIDCVVISELSAKEFHEKYEGYGVLMQFPVSSGQEQVDALMAHLNTIAGLKAAVDASKGD